MNKSPEIINRPKHKRWQEVTNATGSTARVAIFTTDHPQARGIKVNPEFLGLLCRLGGISHITVLTKEVIENNSGENGNSQPLRRKSEPAITSTLIPDIRRRGFLADAEARVVSWGSLKIFVDEVALERELETSKENRSQSEKMQGLAKLLNKKILNEVYKNSKRQLLYGGDEYNEQLGLSELLLSSALALSSSYGNPENLGTFLLASHLTVDILLPYLYELSGMVYSLNHDLLYKTRLSLFGPHLPEYDRLILLQFLVKSTHVFKVKS